MDNSQRSFEIARLAADRKLLCTIGGPDGTILAAKGTCITQRLLDDWARQGITTAYVLGESESVAETGLAELPSLQQFDSTQPLSDADLQLLRPYDRQAMKRLQADFAQASHAVENVVLALASDELAEFKPLTQAIEGFLSEIELDMAAVLGSLAAVAGVAPSSKDMFLAERCARMSVLATVVSFRLEYALDECQMSGLVGMLHDISLFDAATDAVARIYGHENDAARRYFDHPLQSASLLSGLPDLSEQARQIISQVHEDVQGTGFPRGLLPHRTHRVAKLINLIDAYLTLTAEHQPAPLPPGGNLLPADAIAYLLHHTTHGRFGNAEMRGLVNATSLYPIGSFVELSDNVAAVVHRTSTSPAEPIVRLDAGHGGIVDLRNSHLSIERPIAAHGTGRRIRLSELDQVLWRSDELASEV